MKAVLFKPSNLWMKACTKYANQHLYLSRANIHHPPFTCPSPLNTLGDICVSPLN